MIDLKGKRITLVFEGIDYSSEIFLNGVSLGKQEGMYVPWSMDVSAKLLPGETNLLAVVLEPAPFEQPQVGKTSLVYTHKSRMTYWWDFCPRMIDPPAVSCRFLPQIHAEASPHFSS